MHIPDIVLRACRGAGVLSVAMRVSFILLSEVLGLFESQTLFSGTLHCREPPLNIELLLELNP